MGSLDESECRRRLAESRHGVLATVSSGRGVDAVPTVFALDGDTIWTPIDSIKPKRSAQLTRLANVAADPRVCLLVDGWDEDWTGLWWVRAHGDCRLADEDELGRARSCLAARYHQYQDPGSIVAALRVDSLVWSGWSAAD